MQRLMNWPPFQPPVITGYWPSLVRLLMGALVLMRLSEVSIPRIAVFNPEILICAALWIVAAICVTAGLFTRAALLTTSLMCFGSFYVYVFDLQTPKYIWFAFADRGSYGEPTNVYFSGVVLLLLAFTPSADHYSVDAWLGRVVRSPSKPLWAVQLILFQICAMYFWTAMVKLNPAFISGAALESAWILSVAGSVLYSHDPHYQPYFQILSILVVLTEFALTFLLLFPRTRKIGILLGLAFHGFAMMIFPVRYYSFAVAIAYLLFLDPPEHERRI